MKPACSSTAFDELLRSGELTQLEWLDLCAHDVAADGAVFDVRHFPRTDTDYLAQIKKAAADYTVTVTAVRDDGFFGAQAAVQEQTLALALALGAPLLSSTLPPETQISRSGMQERVSAACSAAKRANVTLALRNAPRTFGTSTHDLKRTLKEADSAWLRFGPDLGAFDVSDETAAIVEKSVLAWVALDADPAQSIRLLGAYRGFVVLDAARGNASMTEMKNAVRAWRKALSENDDRT